MTHDTIYPTDYDALAVVTQDMHDAKRPAKFEDLDEGKQQGSQFMTVHLNDVPLAIMSKLGTALEALEKSPNVVIERSYGTLTLRSVPTAPERAAKLKEAQEAYDRKREQWLEIVWQPFPSEPSEYYKRENVTEYCNLHGVRLPWGV